MDDLISRQDAIDVLSQYPFEKVVNCISIIEELPSAQTDSCNGCKWEYAFGYGECHHCKRRYDDMYEVKDDE